MLVDLTPSEVALLFVISHRHIKRDIPGWATEILNRIDMPDCHEQWREIADTTGEALFTFQKV